jgi:hypothetical protein
MAEEEEAKAILIVYYRETLLALYGGTLVSGANRIPISLLLCMKIGFRDPSR